VHNGCSLPQTRSCMPMGMYYLICFYQMILHETSISKQWEESDHGFQACMQDMEESIKGSVFLSTLASPAAGKVLRVQSSSRPADCVSTGAKVISGRRSGQFFWLLSSFSMKRCQLGLLPHLCKGKGRRQTGIRSTQEIGYQLCVSSICDTLNGPVPQTQTLAKCNLDP
jgi:hypothetical protein